jgi:hypothetical protein
MSRSTLVVGLGPTRPAVTIGLADSAKQLTAMALHLSEPSSVTDPAGGQTPNTAQWVIEVYVQYQEGEYLLGIVTSTSVAAGSRAARTLALAYCPGAKTWRVVVFGPVGATCAVRLSSDECCNGGFVGLVPANDGQVQTLRVSPFATLVQQGVLAPGPATLFRMRIFVDPGVGPVFIGPVDKATAVVNGDLFADLPVQFIAGGVGTVGNYERVWEKGLVFTRGIRWACSSTPGLVTLAAAASVGGETS